MLLGSPNLGRAPWQGALAASVTHMARMVRDVVPREALFIACERLGDPGGADSAPPLFPPCAASVVEDEGAVKLPWRGVIAPSTHDTKVGAIKGEVRRSSALAAAAREGARKGRMACTTTATRVCS